MASINTNISAYYAQSNLRKAGDAAQASIAKLSSGNRINRASDDVAGLSIGTVLRTTVNTLKTASTNASQATTLLQVADGALSSLGEILQRQKALSVQANSGTLSDNERGYLNQEFSALTSEYDRIVSKTNFNGVNLLDGSISGTSGLNGATSTAQTVVGIPTTGNTVDTGANLPAFSGTYNDKVVGSLSNAVVSIYDTLGTGVKDIVSVNINGVVFASDQTDLHSAGASTITLKNGAAVLTLKLASTTGATATQAAATTLAAAIQADLRQASIYQTRAISSTTGAATAIDSNTFNGTSLQGVSGSNFVLISKDYNANGTGTPAISGFAVSKYDSTAGINGKISVNINGDKYSLALGSTNTTSGKLNASTAYILTSESDANSKLTFTTSGLTLQPDVSTDTGANALADTLNKGFGTGSAGGLSFQVGSSSSDQIGISIKDVKSSSVYKDSTGASQNLDISTAAGAVVASDVLDIAIKSLTSTRADIGALQSRFNFASATLQVSIQNLDAARGSFLDTDVSEESTKFASAQVLSQAAISVLAQANQIPQNLLKLIG